MKIAALLTFSVLSIFSFSARAQTDRVNPKTPVYNGPPAAADAVIYEIDTRHFSKGSNINGVINGLDGIKALGANVIYLMPIYPTGNSKYSDSPYCISDYTSLNTKLGTMDDLRALVKSSHQRNIAVIIDWVANHTAYDNAWVENRDWYLRDNAGNPISPPGKGWDGVAQLNYNNGDMRAAMIEAMKYWVLNAGIDGFRCDFADGPPLDFWKDAIASTRKAAKRKLFFLAESSTAALYNVGFDLISGFDFYTNVKKVYQQNTSVKGIASTILPGARYISNHDVLGSDGPTAKVFDNDRGAMAAFVVASSQGPPIIYASQEGVPAKSKGVHVVDYTSEQINPEYKKILAVRKNSEAIKRGRTTSYSNDDVYAVKKNYRGETVLVICNLRNRALSYPVPGSLGRLSWVDLPGGRKKQLSTKIELEPFGYLILKAVK